MAFQRKLVDGEFRALGAAVHAAGGNDPGKQAGFFFGGGQQEAPAHDGEKGGKPPAPPVGYAAGERQIGRFLSADEVAEGNARRDLTPESAHAHLIAPVADRDDGCFRVSCLGKKERRIRNHVVDDFAAHVVVVSVRRFSGALQTDQMRRGAVADEGADERFGLFLRKADQHCLRVAVLKRGLQERVGDAVRHDADAAAGRRERRRQIGRSRGAVRFPGYGAVRAAHGKAGQKNDPSGSLKGSGDLL